MITSEKHCSASRSLPTRRRVLAGLFGLGASAGIASPASAIAPALMDADAQGVAQALDLGTRSIALHEANTGERLDVTYSRDGHYDAGALVQLDAFMRDWRNDAVTHIDPALFDMIWALGRAVGQEPEFTVICGYRSPETNEMLIRAGHRGVARNSMHTEGRAADIALRDGSLRTLRDAAIALQAGGVGYYPSSGFVHVDTGAVRTW